MFWNILMQWQYTAACFIYWTLFSIYWTSTFIRSIYCDVLIIIVNNIKRVQWDLVHIILVPSIFSSFSSSYRSSMFCHALLFSLHRLLWMFDRSLSALGTHGRLPCLWLATIGHEIFPILHSSPPTGTIRYPSTRAVLRSLY